MKSGAVTRVSKSWIAISMASMLWLAAGASAQTKPEAPGKPTDGSLPAAPGKLPESVGAAVDPNKYVLGSEDVIFIKTWREPDFTFQVAVRPDGKITVPLVGEVQAGGLTPQQLTTDLKESLSKFINKPDVTIFVTDVRSKKYFIDGQVNRAGSFPLVTPTTVLEALSNAGGFRDFANTKKIKVLRGTKSYKFNWKDVTSGKNQEQNILLESGDHIIVP